MEETKARKSTEPEFDERYFQQAFLDMKSMVEELYADKKKREKEDSLK